MSTDPFILPLDADLRRRLEEAAGQNAQTAALFAADLIEAHVEERRYRASLETAIVAEAVAALAGADLVEEEAMDRFVAALAPQAPIPPGGRS